MGWFAKADIFVNPSVTENFCTTTNEALASGTPVVAVVAPSTAEQVFSGVNGFLAAPNNPEDFAQKVITILENPDLKHHHPHKPVLQFLNLIGQLVHKSLKTSSMN